MNPKTDHLVNALRDLARDGSSGPDDRARLERAIQGALGRRPSRTFPVRWAVLVAAMLLGLSALAAVAASQSRRPNDSTPVSPPGRRAKPAHVVQSSPAAPPVPSPTEPASPVPSAASPIPTVPRAAETRKTLSAAEIFASANRTRKEGDYAKAASLYRQLQGEHPASVEASLSRVSLGRILLDRLSSPGEALEQFDAYLGAGGAPLREEAMVGRAQALHQLSRADDESSAWRDLLDAYPNSAWADTARQRSGAR